MSGWNAHIDILTASSEAIKRAAVIGLADGSIWACSGGANEFRATEIELKTLCVLFTDLASVPKVGVDLEGVHYIVPKTEENLIFGEKDKTGFFAVKTAAVVLIAMFEGEAAARIEARLAVENLVVYVSKTTKICSSMDQLSTIFSFFSPNEIMKLLVTSKKLEKVIEPTRVRILRDFDIPYLVQIVKNKTLTPIQKLRCSLRRERTIWWLLLDTYDANQIAVVQNSSLLRNLSGNIRSRIENYIERRVREVPDINVEEEELD